MDSIAKVFRIVALAKEILEEKEKLKLTGRPLTPEQQIKIDQLLRQFTEVLMNKPGYTSAAVHNCEHQPIRTPLYRLCPAWCPARREVCAGIKMEFRMCQKLFSLFKLWHILF